MDQQKGELVHTLNTPASDTNMFNLNDRPELQIQDDVVKLPTKNARSKKINTVSKKEIVLALLQHGRLTRFNGVACDIEVLKDHVAMRQNIVSWAKHITWKWPDGEYAEWNKILVERDIPSLVCHCIWRLMIF